MNYSLKIDIKKLNKAFVYGVQGKTEKIECVCIPTSEFYKGKNGELYCNIEAVERKIIGQYGDTHIAKQQLEKASYSALTDDQKKNIPILGNMQPSKFSKIETVVAEDVNVKTPQKAEDEPPF